MPIIEDNAEYQLIETVTATGKTVQIIHKPGSHGENLAALYAKANAALVTNATYLAIGTPSAAQNTAQAKALTRQVNAMIKLMLGLLDDLNGT